MISFSASRAPGYRLKRMLVSPTYLPRLSEGMSRIGEGGGARIFIFNDPDLFTQKDLVPQSNKQTTWHKADIEEGREDK